MALFKPNPSYKNVGGIISASTTFEAFTADDLYRLLNEHSPLELVPLDAERSEQKQIAFLPNTHRQSRDPEQQRQLFIRWFKLPQFPSATGGRDLLLWHESELRRLQSHRLTVPSHASFMVNRDPHFDNSPVHYTVLGQVGNGEVLHGDYEGYELDLAKVDPTSHKYAQLIRLGRGLCGFYAYGPTGDPYVPYPRRRILSDLYRPSQWSLDTELYDFDPRYDIRLAERVNDLSIIRSWAGALQGSLEQEQLLHRLGVTIEGVRQYV